MEKKQALPEYLKQLRKFYCYKQKDIALQLGITRQTYSHYETGRITPSIKILYRLAKIYGISMDEILKQVEADAQEGTAEKSLFDQNIDEADVNLFQKDFLSCFQSLSEKDRRETLSIMWEIMQAKKKIESGGLL